jgi:HD-like signal output (HDOD) protein
MAARNCGFLVITWQTKEGLMTFVLMGFLVLLAGLAVFFLRTPSKPARAQPRQAPEPSPGADKPLHAPVLVQLTSLATPGLPVAAPETLAAFRLVHRDELDTGRRQAIVAALGSIPRPPQSLQSLVSGEFMARATSAELSAVVMSEPLMAVKVLASVNSSFYGLTTPVASMGQAITFLGFNTVRSIGLQYMLSDAFKASSPELNQVFDTFLASSALASELCVKVARKLDLPDQGVLVTHLMLSFIGQLATYSLMPAGSAVATARLEFFARVQAEQAQLGLGAAEIGSLLMHAWGLPPSLIDDVHDIDRTLVTPAQAMDTQRGTRLALCFLCARLGEKLARGSLRDLAAFDLAATEEPEFFHLQSYLAAPALARLPEYLRAPDLLAFMAQRQASLQGRS